MNWGAVNGAEYVDVAVVGTFDGEQRDGLMSDRARHGVDRRCDRKRNASEAVIWVTERCANVRESALGGWLRGKGAGVAGLGVRWKS